MPTKKIIFACDICGTEYETEEFARFCETLNPLPPSKHQCGDTIAIGGSNRIVNRITIEASWGNILLGWEGNPAVFKERFINGREQFVYPHSYRYHFDEPIVGEEGMVYSYLDLLKIPEKTERE